ncbi:pyridoxamine 5'-phosphate oxidase family protein [Verminephrobacter aporrectodeae]|uniref:pyridoxamine 5'-phosphate oxidase family protein n=1 Tax=Verminephrobacter aporrectodeae TaxID=1110389 RepID=UPI0022389075|nr:pyridoxamine 5'-phosphate oxidase family protein [Verminephrobacter aporrectodeae]
MRQDTDRRAGTASTGHDHDAVVARRGFPFFSLKHAGAPMENLSSFDTAPEHRVRRKAQRAAYDRETVYSILDAGYFCHVALVVDARPVVVPMTYWREDDFVYFHSAAAGRFANAFCSGEVCISICHFDGLVLGHSAINHSMNYRSVVVHGVAEKVEGQEHKRAAMKNFFTGIFHSRWDQLRPLRDAEIDAVNVFRLKLEQVAAKIRDELPDPERFMPDWPVWTGVIPAHCAFAEPVADPRMDFQPPLPEDLQAFRGKDGHVPGCLGAPGAPDRSM